MLAGFSRGAWEFVVGDDWRVALGVGLTLAATAAVATVGLAAWWIAPVAILAILHRSIRRAGARPREFG